MADPMHVELVSPERILYSGEADMVICRTIGGGDIAFMADHAPFLGALDDAVTRIKKTDGEWEDAAVHGGFVHVRDNNVIVLSDLAELASQIDFERARRDRERLESEAMDHDDVDVEANLRRVHVRLSLEGAHSG